MDVVDAVQVYILEMPSKGLPHAHVEISGIDARNFLS